MHLRFLCRREEEEEEEEEVVHATGDNEATQSLEQIGHPLNEDNYNEVYENILQQLMETDEYEKLRVWTSDVEKRDVYLKLQGRHHLHGRK